MLKEKRLRSTKKHFTYEAADEVVITAMKRLETGFFNVVVDCSIQSLEDRFKSVGEIKDKFGVLLSFHKLDEEILKEQCAQLGKADIDWRELAMEMQRLPGLPEEVTTALELLMHTHERGLSELFPNLWVALRIACTLPVTVATAGRSFSKLKLIKTFLRSSMCQERLSGTAMNV